MTLGIVGVLVLVAFVITIAHAMGKAPLWPAVVLVLVAMLLGLGVPR